MEWRKPVLHAALTYIKEQSEEVKEDWDKIAQVAKISANNDDEIGLLIADAMKRVGTEGIITVENSPTSETYIEEVQGLRYDRGFISPYFVNNPAKMTVELDAPYILLTDGKLRSSRDIVPILEKVHAANAPLLVIAEEVDAQALNILVVNKVQNGAPYVATKIPWYGQFQKQILEDLAIMTGGKVVSQDAGLTMSGVELEDLGRAEKIIVTSTDTTIINGHGDQDMVKERQDALRALLNDPKTDDYHKEKYRDRLAKLAGAVAVLHIGAATEVELREKKDRVDDALHATKAAIKEGILPGGGSGYLNAIKKMGQELSTFNNRDEKLGWEIVLKALEAPFRTIVENSGKSPDQVLARIEEGKGFDANKGKYVDMKAEGIIDPAKVTRLALENALSVSSNLLMTEASVSIKDEPEMFPPGM